MTSDCAADAGRERPAMLPRLKAATASAHARLERSVGVFERAATPERYVGLLARFYGIYAPLEACLAATADWPALGYDFAARCKTPLLERDLLALPGAEGRLPRLPRCGALPDVSTLPRALGCLYVVEGSTLGGQVIARELLRRHGISPERGAAFFTSYAAAVGPRWRAFKGWTETLARAMSDNEQAAMIAAATETFDRFSCWMSIESAETGESRARGERTA